MFPVVPPTGQRFHLFSETSQHSQARLAQKCVYDSKTIHSNDFCDPLTSPLFQQRLDGLQ